MITALVAAPALLAADAASSGGLPGWVTTLLIPLIIALGGGGGVYSLLTVKNNKKQLNAGTAKIRAEAADILSDTAVAMLTPLREELDRLKERVSTSETEVGELRRTLAQERFTSDTRIRQLEADIAERDRTIVELRGRLA